jgi:hypothetical protein
MSIIELHLSLRIRLSITAKEDGNGGTLRSQTQIHLLELWLLVLTSMMVFHDVRMNYNYTEPTLAGNAGLVAALVALSGDRTTGIDKNTIFSSVPPMFPTPPPPPAPWKP